MTADLSVAAGQPTRAGFETGSALPKLSGRSRLPHTRWVPIQVRRLAARRIRASEKPASLPAPTAMSSIAGDFSRRRLTRRGASHAPLLRLTRRGAPNAPWLRSPVAARRTRRCSGSRVAAHRTRRGTAHPSRHAERAAAPAHGSQRIERAAAPLRRRGTPNTPRRDCGQRIAAGLDGGQPVDRAPAARQRHAAAAAAAGVVTEICRLDDHVPRARIDP